MVEQALDEFRRIVGEEFVLDNVEKIRRYHRCTIPVERVIDGVLLPGGVEEIRRIVAIANRFNIRLYPISTGKNWGYGSANPVRDRNVILDLSRMNRILEVNKELAYAVIEPGVTQRQLHDKLTSGKTGLMMDPTGSGPACSVLGNALERGYGITPYGDHFAATCGMEIVLANGEVLRTGFGHFGTAKAANVYKYGVGPYIDGLFTQSNFGIVTKIGVWLMPEPERFEACYFSCDKESDLGQLIDALRWLLLNRVVKGSINVVHRNRALTMLTRYPWEEMSGETPLSEAVYSQMAAEKRVGAWNGVTALYGAREEVSAAKKVIKRLLRGKVARINFSSEQTLRLAERFPKLIGLLTGMNISEVLKVLKPSFAMLKGRPGEVSLPTPYWRMKKPVPPRDIDPAEDSCGLIWLSPVVPMTKENAEEFIGVIRPIFARHGFEDCITFTAVNERCFDCTLPILYDKSDPAETKRAAECHDELFRACMDKGYIPYRLGIQSMAGLVGGDDVFWDVVQKLKQALDPQGILSPGRYSTI